VYSSNPTLYLAGGTSLTAAQMPFETFKVNIDSRKWERLCVPKNINTPIGTRPELFFDHASQDVTFMMFSG
jgi:hypothetical protein